jgi:hypothetical protein
VWEDATIAGRVGRERRENPKNVVSAVGIFILCIWLRRLPEVEIVSSIPHLEDVDRDETVAGAGLTEIKTFFNTCGDQRLHHFKI